MTTRFLVFALLLMTGLAGCLSEDDAPAADDDAPTQPTEPAPYVPPESFKDMEWLNVTGDGATGIWLHDDRAYLSGSAGLRIVDIRDPANPVMLHEGVEDTSSRDVDILVHPNGRVYATLSGGGVKLVDVTDPATATLVSTASVSSHNHGVVPNSTVVYNSRSISAHTPAPGETGQIDIVDFADPENPVVTVFAFPAVVMTPSGPREVASTTCHDMTFNEELKRAYCAGVTDTTIWDITDPLQPEIIQVIDWPAVNIHHGVWDARGGDLLILGDEFAGAIAGPMCSSVVEYPTSALWFFDISNLATPTPIGYFNVEWDSAGVEQRNFNLCTTHFGDIVEGMDMLVMGWYAAGTVLVDFTELSATNPLGIEQVAHYRPTGNVNTWEAQEYKGHVYTGDTARGMDILRLV